MKGRFGCLCSALVENGKRWGLLAYCMGLTRGDSVNEPRIRLRVLDDRHPRLLRRGGQDLLGGWAYGVPQNQRLDPGGSPDTLVSK